MYTDYWNVLHAYIYNQISFPNIVPFDKQNRIVIYICRYSYHVKTTCIPLYITCLWCTLRYWLFGMQSIPTIFVFRVYMRLLKTAIFIWVHLYDVRCVQSHGGFWRNALSWEPSWHRITLSINPASRGPFYKHRLTFIPPWVAWINDHIPSEVWDENTYPFPNFNDAAVEGYGWINNFIPDCVMDVIIYPCWD